MTRAFTGGYDTCLELTDDVMSSFAMVALQKQLTTLNALRAPDAPPSSAPPPIPFFLIDGATSLVGSAQLHVSAVNVAAENPVAAPALLTLAISFSGSSIQIDGGQVDPATQLSGTLRIPSVPITLSRSNDRTTAALDLSNLQEVRIDLRGESHDRVADLAGRLGVGVDVLVAAIEEGALGILSGLTLPIDSLALKMSPLGADGTPTDGVVPDSTHTPVLAAIALQTRVHTSSHPGVLAVLATFLARHLALSPSPADKTVTTTTYSHSASLSLSPEAFLDLQFCPALVRAAQKLLPPGTTDGLSDSALIAQLPRPCGAASFRVGEVLITSLTPFLHERSIALYGKLTFDAGGAAGRGTFVATMQLSFVDGEIIPQVSLQKEDVHAQVTTGPGIRILSVLNPFLLRADFVAHLFEVIAHGKLFDTLSEDLKLLQDAIAVPSTVGFVAKSIEIHTDGILIEGQVPRAATSNTPTGPFATLAIGVSEAVLAKSDGAVQTGVLHTCFPEKTYRSRRESYQLEKTFTPATTGMTPPIHYSWTLGGLPLVAPGGALVATDAGISYRLNETGDRLVVNNVDYRTPGTIGGAPFDTTIVCSAVDSLGFEQHRPLQVHFASQADIPLDPAYETDLRQCLATLGNRFKEHPPRAEGPLPHHDTAAGGAPLGARGGDPLGVRAQLSALISRSLQTKRLLPSTLSQLAVKVRLAGVAAPWLDHAAVTPSRFSFVVGSPP